MPHQTVPTADNALGSILQGMMGKTTVLVGVSLIPGEYPQGKGSLGLSFLTDSFTLMAHQRDANIGQTK